MGGRRVQFSIYQQLPRINVKRFRGGLVFKAHRLVYHSPLGWRVIKKKKGDRAKHMLVDNGKFLHNCIVCLWYYWVYKCVMRISLLCVQVYYVYKCTMFISWIMCISVLCWKVELCVYVYYVYKLNYVYKCITFISWIMCISL